MAGQGVPEGAAMPFFRYQKIYGALGEYKPDPAAMKAHKAHRTWVVQEKVHGANFSVYYQRPCGGGGGEALRYAKRNGFLDADSDWFYGFQADKDTLVDGQVRKLWGWVKEKVARDADPDEVLQVVVYGELCGGYYPEKDLSLEEWQAVRAGRVTAEGVCRVALEDRAVQEGIYYAPQLSFVAFDVGYRLGDATALTLMDYPDVAAACAAGGFFTPPPLLVTEKYEAAIAVNVNFDSTIAAGLHAHRHGQGAAVPPPPPAKAKAKGKKPVAVSKPAGPGMPQIPAGGNPAEGVVIRPWDNTVVLEAGGPGAAPKRCLIKKKNKLYAEIADLQQDFDEEEAKRNYTFTLPRMVTSNRLAAVLSKDPALTAAFAAVPRGGGALDAAACGTLAAVEDAFVADVWEDYYTAFAYSIADPDKADAFLRGRVAAFLGRVCRDEQGV